MGQLASDPSMGKTLLCSRLEEAKGVIIREGPMRAWLSAYRGSSASIGPMPVQGNSSSSSGTAMAVLDLSGLSDYSEYLRQQLLEAPDIAVMAMRDKLIGAYGVSCSERTMRSWLERARAPIPRRAIKRASSDLPTLGNLNADAGFLSGMLAEDASIGRRKIREAMKGKGYLVSEQVVRTWLDRYHGVRERDRKT